MNPLYSAHLLTNAKHFLKAHQDYDRGYPRASGKTRAQLTEVGKLARDGYNVIFVAPNWVQAKENMATLMHCPWLSGLDPLYNPVGMDIALTTGVRIRPAVLNDTLHDRIRGTRRTLVMFDHHLLDARDITPRTLDLLNFVCVNNTRAFEDKATIK